MPGTFTINVALDPSGNALVVTQPGSSNANITVNSSNKPATIQFVPGQGLRFDTNCFSLQPTPPSGDFVVSMQGNSGILQVVDNDTDTSDTTYEYTICAYKSDGTRLCYDPQIYNQAT